MIELDKKTLKNIFLVIVGAIVLYWLLNAGVQVRSVFSVLKSILSPFILGAALSFILNVPMRAFENLLKKIKNGYLRRVIALVLTFVVVLLILVLVFWLLIPQVIDTIQSLIPKLQTFFMNMGKMVMDFLNDNPEVMEWIMDNTGMESFDWASLVEKFITMLGDSVSKILDGTLSAIGSVSGAAVDVVIGLMFSIYCLFQKETLARQGRKLLYAFLPEKASDYIVRVLRLSNSTFSNFLSGQCIEVCILGCMFAISMAIFKMPYIPLVSVLVAVTAFIPVVGAFIGCIVGAFLILVNDPMQAFWFVVMFLVIQQIENNVIYPRVVGTSIGLSGMWVLLAVAIGGELMGAAGMFLMIPLASVLYALLREITNSRLSKKNIAPDKLKDQPPELRSHLKEKHRARKERIALKKLSQKNPPKE